MIKSLEYYINNLNVLYEDNHLLVIEKPENVLSQKDNTNDFDINEIVKEWLKRKYNKQGNVYLGLVHRLDRRVGGVMVLAKTSKAASRLAKSVQNHEIHKLYLAYASGIISHDGNINIKIVKENNIAKIDNNGKDASLSYKVLNNYDNNTFVLVDLNTGRYNQIRLSFSHIGHPLIGDYKYGCKITNDRIGLWCYEISFIHPITKEYLEFRLLPNGDFWSGLKYKK